MKNKKSFYADLHVHSHLKSYGRFRDAGGTGINGVDDPASLWYVDEPGKGFESAAENLLGIPAYRQASLDTCAGVGLRLVHLSLYPTERGFFSSKDGDGVLLKRVLSGMVAGVGENRVKEILADDFSYYQDLQREIAYLKEAVKQHSKNGKKLQLVTGAASLNACLSDPDSVAIVLNIEGAHVLADNNRPIPEGTNLQELFDRIEWLRRENIFYITPGHHFYNGLVSHSESLGHLPKGLADQREGMDTPVGGNGKYITSVGYAVIRRMLDNRLGRRILIDVKHMALPARWEYYRLLQEEYTSEDIPILFSHGAFTGRSRANAGGRGNGQFYNHAINLYDDELLLIARSGGLVGIEMDQRVLGHESTGLRKIADVFERFWMQLRRRSDEYWAAYFAQQVMHGVTVLDRAGFDRSWNVFCLGSDYDGVINPLNPFRSVADLPRLEAALLKIFDGFIRKHNWQEPANRIDPEAAVRNVLSDNLTQFTSCYFR